MLIRLLRAKRLLVGRLVALIYLVCVLAPGSALASGNARISDHCLFDDAPPMASTGHHDHASHSAGAMHQHDHGAAFAEKSALPEPPQHHHRTIDLQCCALCIAALPASISDIVTPCPAHAFALPEAGGHLADNSPPLHYRPPIA
jgi:hypothetical protein